MLAREQGGPRRWWSCDYQTLLLGINGPCLSNIGQPYAMIRRGAERFIVCAVLV